MYRFFIVAMALFLVGIVSPVQAQTIIDPGTVNERTLSRDTVIDTSADKSFTFTLDEYFSFSGTSYLITAASQFTSGSDPSLVVTYTSNFRHGRVPQTGDPGWEQTTTEELTLDLDTMVGSPLPGLLLFEQDFLIREITEDGPEGDTIQRLEINYGHSVSATTIPEPATMASLLMGLVFVGRLRRSQQV